MRHALDADGWLLGGHPAVSGEDRAARPRSELTATDRLTRVFLAGLAMVAAASHPRPLPLLSALGALALAILGSARWSGRSKLGRWVHDFLPVANVIAIFNLSGPIIATANPTRWDGTFSALDRALFGALPEAWFGAFGRPAWLVDAAAVVYASYYVIPVAMAVALYRAGRRADFDRLVFTVVATFLISYLCYFLMPALGPRVPLGRESDVVGGGAASELFRAFLHAAEFNELDAFPSGHTALSLVFLVLSWQLFPKWRIPMAALVAGIIFSTVYLSLHYVIDLVAGALLAGLMPFAVPALYRLASAREVASLPAS
jgi:membrane-associated phospholipid phosphatase